ncbi:hypothetical protein CEY08_28860 [Achromobacter insolitus]|nr:hypothetical protein CEY08_28860 [Achromobacter insolitus]
MGKPLITLKYQTGESFTVHLNSLVGANFRDVNFHRIIFDGMDLRGADFSRANLRNVGFVEAEISDVKMQNAFLVNSYFMGAKMHFAKLTGATLVGADFTGADLTGAIFFNANAQFSCFQKAKLTGADMRVENAERALWAGSIYDEKTLWPMGFDPEKFGAIRN